MKLSASPDSRLIPTLTRGDLQASLIHRLRLQASTVTPGHPWGSLNDDDLLRATELSVQDPLTGQTLYTVAALLLTGTNEAIRAHLPHHGTKALFRPGNWQRGERLDLRTNLLDTYDTLMDFAARHLPDHLETAPDGASFSVRERIFAELFAGSLLYRDYGKPFPARFVIEADRVFLENGGTPGGRNRLLGPNPLLTGVFRQIGLDKGLHKSSGKPSQIEQWGRTYFGLLPLRVEGSVYRVLAPFPKRQVPFPVPAAAWDISDLLRTHAPWTQSMAAKQEVRLTSEALSDLVADPEIGASTIVPPVAVAAPTLRETRVESHVPPKESVPRVAVRTETAVIPTPTVAGMRNQAVIQSDRTERILAFCRTPRYRSELQAHVGIVNRDYFRKDILNPLIEKGLLRPTLPDKPNSPKQQYLTASV